MIDGHVIWDEARLRDIVGDDAEFIIEILELFITSSEAHMAALDDAVRSVRLDDVIRLTHTLKGSSGNIGANAMMEMTNRVELAAKSTNVDAMASAMQNATRIHSLTIERLQARMVMG